jgi:acyl carrier protein
MTDIETWAVEYVSRIDASFSSLGEDQKLAENLFTNGRLDSMALMNFLLDAEAQFGFMFTPESFQDRRLHTISGLGEVIGELRGAA